MLVVVYYRHIIRRRRHHRCSRCRNILDSCDARFLLACDLSPSSSSRALRGPRVSSPGGIPMWLGSMKCLEEIDLSATQLGGERDMSYDGTETEIEHSSSKTDVRRAAMYTTDTRREDSQVCRNRIIPVRG